MATPTTTTKQAGDRKALLIFLLTIGAVCIAPATISATILAMSPIAALDGEGR